MKIKTPHKALVAAGLFAIATSASAITSFGTLSNFDVLNDTGSDTEGFEIELHGVSSSEVSYTFGGPYSRYGTPSMQNFTDANGASGVFVRWQASWNGSTFSTRTIQAPSLSNTGGHACYQGGPIGNYDSSGCEHFGLGLTRSQTSTTYRWLQGNPDGTLTPIGTGIALPAPVFAVVAPDPGVVAPPVVQAVIEAPEAREAEFGEALWMKRIKTQTEQLDHEAKLEDLLSDNKELFPDAESETEIEWFLMQARAGHEQPNKGGGDNPMGDGKKSVVLRWEFYQFAGTYDPESNEALCLDGIANCEDLGSPEAMAPFIGNYIGAQMAGVNLAPVPEPGTWALMLGGLGILGLAAKRRRR